MNLIFSMIRKTIPLAAICFLLMFTATAQKQTIEPDSAGIGVSTKPLNCETTFAQMEEVRKLIIAETEERKVLIMIARLGNGEKGRTLNRRRLSNVKEGFKVTLGIKSPIVTAEGERVAGFGRVDLYLGGKFIGALIATRNSHVIKCEF